jgi:NAD-dependent SIR2 family protein deacetylase
MQLGPIDFPNEVIDALRDDRLVVLAGAGVSIGAPSNMPSFGQLVDDIAQRTGESVGKWEPPDRFLGRLGDGRKVDVHTAAAQALSEKQGAANDLHKALVRLFRKADLMRVVTTNFEFLIEEAAGEVLGQRPRSFEAPAIPVGSDFRGVVHVHGGLSDPYNMVLTDADFGRAYLLEGWARRFL